MSKMHLVMGGRVTDPQTLEFQDLTQADLVGVYPDYASAEKAADRGSMDLEQWFSAVDEAGIDLTVIKARDVETTFGGRVTNEAVAKVVADHPGRFLGFAGVDPNKGMTALRELEDAVTGLGLKGLNIQCFENRLAIDDRRMYPVYAKCIELNIPVNIHVGMNFSLKSSLL